MFVREITRKTKCMYEQRQFNSKSHNKLRSTKLCPCSTTQLRLPIKVFSESFLLKSGVLDSLLESVVGINF